LLLHLGTSREDGTSGHVLVVKKQPQFKTGIADGDFESELMRGS
jgi:hypothetical protein